MSNTNFYWQRAEGRRGEGERRGRGEGERRGRGEKVRNSGILEWWKESDLGLRPPGIARLQPRRTGIADCGLRRAEGNSQRIIFIDKYH